ncbi:SDR family oxidoreductase [Thalassotalea psychrophila]|uniref:SDR family oxidoreductase n=1 Tax=Thalassotalea psychrophila TaxID=3065647 RepID=A0ABY9TZJ4_9GAMM|nr:SDR family oxidoreductase [Colwelliaceae bacterium SQ149]
MSSITDFSGKVAIITGAAQGIGKAAAKAFAEAGANLVITDLSANVNDLAGDIINEFNVKVETLVADISKPDTAKEICDIAIEKFGRLDFAFNNAGIGGKPAHVKDLADEQWLNVININLNSVFYCIKQQVPAMLKNGGGVIINNSSVCGLRPIDGSSIEYTAAKHAVVGLTKQIAVNHGAEGIRCNAVCPGFIATPLTADQDTDWFLSRIPQKRLGTAEDIGKMVRSLCSDDSSYVNGVALQVDGGYLQT